MITVDPRRKKKKCPYNEAAHQAVTFGVEAQ